MRRHMRGVATAATILLLIGGLTGFYTTRLATERDRARREAEKAAKVSELLTGLLTGADPYVTRATRGEPTVRALLDAGAERVQKELAGQPEVQAEIVATTLNNLSRALVEQGRHDEASAVLRDALNIALPTLGSEHPLIAIYKTNLASVHLARNEAGAAEVLLREALQIRVRAPGLVPTRRRTLPADDWSIGATKSLLDAHRDLTTSPGPESREAKATVTRLVALYDAWRRPDKAAAYHTLLP